MPKARTRTEKLRVERNDMEVVLLGLRKGLDELIAHTDEGASPDATFTDLGLVVEAVGAMKAMLRARRCVERVLAVAGGAHG